MDRRAGVGGHRLETAQRRHAPFPRCNEDSVMFVRFASAFSNFSTGSAPSLVFSLLSELGSVELTTGSVGDGWFAISIHLDLQVAA